MLDKQLSTTIDFAEARSIYIPTCVRVHAHMHIWTSPSCHDTVGENLQCTTKIKS